MRLTWLDAAGTALVATIVGLSALFAMGGSDPPVRGIAVVALLLGVTAHLAVGPVTRARGTLRTFGRAGGLAALGLGVVTVATGNAALLSAFVGAIVALWAVALLAHAGVLGGDDHDEPPDDGGDELLDGGPAPDDRREEWDPDRPGPFVPPGDISPMPWTA
jgi:hypothetical protein